VLDKYYRTDGDRQSFVTALFDGTAPLYDRIGHLIAFGRGPRYRQQALERAGLRPGMTLLDVATGTGQVARSAASIVPAPGAVVGLDPSRGMLAEARKARPGPLVQGEAGVLPFRSEAFDMLSMGFALRHVADLDGAFREYRRVLKPGGRVLLLEVSRPASAPARWAIRVYFRQVLPLVMRFSAGHAQARILLRYYWDTIDACVPPATILEVLERTGFVGVERRVMYGVMSEYVGVKGAPLPR
jgi:demethylmenaquinone methyltransferase/2-methoxy-6-polyprenyl-1,4-benzoquinol methylase